MPCEVCVYVNVYLYFVYRNNGCSCSCIYTNPISTLIEQTHAYKKHHRSMSNNHKFI